MGAFWPHPVDTKLFWKERTHIWLQSMSLPDLKSKESAYGRHRGVVFFLDRKLGLYISFSSLLLRQEDKGEKVQGEGEGDRFIKLILRAI